MKRILLLILLIIPCYVFATPADIVVPGTISHGGTMSMTGTGFLTKIPAAPLMWDDGESGTADTAPSQSTPPNSLSQVAYSDIQIGTSREGDNFSEPYQTMYREDDYAPVSQAVPSPHQYSTQYIAGGHEYGVNFGARDVMLTASTPEIPVSSMTRSGTTVSVTTSGVHYLTTGDTIHLEGANQSEYNTSSTVGPWEVTVVDDDQFTYQIGTTPTTPATGTIIIATFSERWFVTWYYRVDPDWPGCQSGENHKITSWQSGTEGFSNVPYSNEYIYMDFQNKPCGNADESYTWNTMKMQNFDGTVNGGSCTNLPETELLWYYNPGSCDTSTRTNTPYDDWTRQETRISNDQGFLKYRIDNSITYDGNGATDFYTSTVGYAGIRSATIGSYYRYTDDPSNATNDNAFRYFDDLYIDNTLSRVVLTDNATYDSSTIIEPQPPITWNDTGITVNVNLGKLIGDTAYAYVFDSDGNRNDPGVPVTIAAETTTINASFNCSIGTE